LVAVTCFYDALYTESGSLRYANAGHDLPYLWRGGDAEELRARGMPLGLMAGIGYEEEERPLSKRGRKRALLQRRAGRGPRS